MYTLHHHIPSQQSLLGHQTPAFSPLMCPTQYLRHLTRIKGISILELSKIPQASSIVTPQTPTSLLTGVDFLTRSQLLTTCLCFTRPPFLRRACSYVSSISPAFTHLCLPLQQPQLLLWCETIRQLLHAEHLLNVILCSLYTHAATLTVDPANVR